MTDTTPLVIACRRCQQPTTWQDNPYRPFCSERCRLIDLGAWASENYRVPVNHGHDFVDLDNDTSTNKQN